MKNLLISQRVDINESYGERRDALDQRWLNFFLSIGLIPILVPNNIEYFTQLIHTNKVDGILLTGGASLAKYGGNTPERDEVEFYLIDLAFENDIPLLGVCRGMQVIQDYFNNQLIEIPNHVGVRHKLLVEPDLSLSNLLEQYKDVNSYHNLGSTEVSSDLKKIAISSDGVIMAIEHQYKDIYGVMWHMERESPFCKTDQELFKRIFS
jgi:N5-(cytidine 5'-diphosphoramidyl)-L-glutamine hydrolase